MCPSGSFLKQLRRALAQVLDHRGAPRLAPAAGGTDILDRAAISNRRPNITVWVTPGYASRRSNTAGRVTLLARVADGGGAAATLLLTESPGLLVLTAERARLCSTEQLAVCGVLHLRLRRTGADLAERARLEGLLPLRGRGFAGACAFALLGPSLHCKLTGAKEKVRFRCAAPRASAQRGRVDALAAARRRPEALLVQCEGATPARGAAGGARVWEVFVLVRPRLPCSLA
eukprot:scaffold73357_cov64-Phaeocystis_antarctica.AAC.1